MLRRRQSCSLRQCREREGKRRAQGQGARRGWDMGITMPDARQLSDEVLEALRFRALHGCELGFPQGEVADLLGVSRETVCRWWSAYTSAGVEALPQERTGRPEGSGRISDEQARHLQPLLDENSPEDL